MARFGWKKEVKKEDTKWGFGEFKNFFNQEGKKWGNSDLFKNVQNAFTRYEQARSQEVSEQSAMELISAHQALLSACENYVTQREGAKTSSGQERFNAISKLMEFQKDFHKQQNLDEIRDLRLVRGLMEEDKKNHEKNPDYTNRTWEQVGAIPIPEITLTEKTESVGNVVNTRFKTEYGGQKGFFTENKEIIGREKSFMNMVAQIDEKTDPLRKKALEENQGEILQAMEKVLEEKTIDENGLRGSLFHDTQMKFYLANAWNQMESDGLTAAIRKKKETEKKEFAKAVIADEKGLQITSNIMDSYHEKLKAERKEPDKIGSFRRRELLNEAINENGNVSEELSQILKENDEILMYLPAPETDRRKNVIDVMIIKEELLQKKAKLDENSQEDRKRMEQIELLVRDDKTLHDLAGIQLEQYAADAVRGSGEIQIDRGYELTSRNVASSRIAELLGQGDMIAHSRKMVVKTDGKTIEGSFMEFAKGIDLQSKDEMDQRKLNQIGDFKTPEFNKAASNMEILDFICGQGDRHGMNMFYQLSEPDENGKRRIVGLQGIDNDIAFGESAAKGFISEHSPGAHQIFFIDKRFADKLRGLNRESLEFAVGDILPKEHMDALEDRLNFMQERLNSGKMIEIDSDEKWALDAYKLEDYRDQKGNDIPLNKTDLDEEGKLYVEGLKELAKRSSPFGMHKEQTVERFLQGRKNRLDAYEASQDELYGDMQEMFKEAEPPVREKVGIEGIQKPTTKEIEAEKTTEKTSPVRQKADIRIGEHRAGKQMPVQTKKKQAPPLPKRPERKNEQTGNKDQKQSEHKAAMGRR